MEKRLGKLARNPLKGRPQAERVNKYFVRKLAVGGSAPGAHDLQRRKEKRGS